MEERQGARLFVCFSYSNLQLCIHVQDGGFLLPRAETDIYSYFAPLQHPVLLRVRHFCDLTKAALFPVKTAV